MFNLRFVDIKDKNDLRQELKNVGVSVGGVSVMVDKGRFHVLRADHLSVPATLILKQELLAIGGEAAVNQQVIVHGVSESSVLLMATESQYAILVSNLRKQQFKLPLLAEEIEKILAEPSQRIIHGKKKDLVCGEKTLIMGIVNVTPDSFYDGGKYFDCKLAIEHILRIAEAGADVIDIGGASSRPGFEPLAAEEEMARVLPVIEAVVPFIEQPISVDTEKAQVAEAALAAGASIINDIEGLKDPAMINLGAATGAPVIIMHNSRGVEHGQDIVGEMLQFFRDKIAQVLQMGVQEEQIILDPGLGFGKNTEQNLRILRDLQQFKSLPYPLLVAASQKRFIGDVLDLPVEERLLGSSIVAAISAMNGADMLRVHNVEDVVQVLKMTDAIKRGAK